MFKLFCHTTSMACKYRHDLESNYLEALWLEIRLNNRKFSVCVLYRIPNDENDFWNILSEKSFAVKEAQNIKLLSLAI